MANTANPGQVLPSRQRADARGEVQAKEAPKRLQISNAATQRSGMADNAAMAEQPATALVDGEVTLVYGLRATNTEEEDNGPLATHARRVLSVEVLVDAVNERRADVFFYDELADAASRLDIERGARLWLEASPAWLRPAGDHPRMAADPLQERRRAGAVALAPRDLLMAAQTPDALRAWRCCVHRNDNWMEVDQPPPKRRSARPSRPTSPTRRPIAWTRTT